MVRARFGVAWIQGQQTPSQNSGVGVTVGTERRELVYDSEHLRFSTPLSTSPERSPGTACSSYACKRLVFHFLSPERLFRCQPPRPFRSRWHSRRPPLEPGAAKHRRRLPLRVSGHPGQVPTPSRPWFNWAPLPSRPLKPGMYYLGETAVTF